MAYVHTYRNKSQANGLKANPSTHAHTPGARATVAVLSLIIAGTTARTGGAPTIDGVTATQAGTNRGGTGYEQFIEVWYVCKIFSGSEFTVSVPNTNTRTIHLEVVTADAGTGFISQYYSTGGNNSTSTSSIGATFNQLNQGDFKYIRAGCGEAATGSLTISWTGNVEVYQNDHGAYISESYYLICGASNANPTWTLSADDVVTQGVCFSAVPVNVVTCVISS
jgi:hypothetical protein